jgi:RNA polymerase sigma-70 factor, ECF subfamily
VRQQPARTPDGTERVEADAALVALVRRGDAVAFDTIFRAYYNGLCEYARGVCGSLDAAEELVQDVFMWIWTHRDQWGVTGSVRGYLYGAVRNRALNVLRQDHRAGERWGASWSSESDHTIPGMGLGPRSTEQSVAASEIEAAVGRAIARLPRRCREVYTLRWYHDLSYVEIGQALGISPKTVDGTTRRSVRGGGTRRGRDARPLDVGR